MSRHVTAAPANEIAIGRKIIDFAIGLAAAQPVGERREREPDADGDERHEDDPAGGVPDRPQHAVVREQELEVVESDEAVARSRPSG